MRSAYRRTTTAHMIAMQRTGGFIFRSTAVRLALIVLIAVVVATSSGVSGWVWAPVVAGLVVTPFLLHSAWHDMRGTRSRNPVTRWLRADGERNKGKNATNFGGITEGVLMLSFAVVAGWGAIEASESVRLLLLGLAVVYAGTCLHNIFVDPAFYNPTVAMPRWEEASRRFVGVLVAAVAAAIVLPAPWTTSGRWMAAAVCGLLVVEQLLIAATDELMSYSTTQAVTQAKTAKKFVAASAHRYMTGPMFNLKSMTEDRREQNPQLHRAVLQTDAAYREILELAERDRSIDWPGAVVGGLRQAVEGYGGVVHFSPPDEPLSEGDRAVARDVLIEFATNAAKAGANEVTVQLTRHGTTYNAKVVDDAPPIDDRRWLRSGGGVRRLLDLHQEVGLTIAVLPSTESGHKVITAQWNSTKPEQPK